MSNSSRLSTYQYDDLLQAWPTLSGLSTEIPFGAVKLNYCDENSAIRRLINTYCWTISGGSYSCSNARQATSKAHQESHKLGGGLFTNTNPVKGTMKLRAENNYTSTFQIHVYNSKVVYPKTITKNKQPDLGSLKKGT